MAGPRSLLTPKLLLLLSAFLVLQALQVAIGIHGLNLLERRAALGAAIEEQRLQTLLPGQAAHGGSQRYAQGLRDLEHALLEQGFDLALSAPARDYWHERLSPLLQQQMDTAAWRRYQAAVPGQLERLERIARRVQERRQGEARRLVLLQGGLLGLSLFLVVVGALKIRSRVVHPLQRLIVAAQAVVDGAYDRLVDVNTAGELRALAEVLNRLALSVDQKTARLHALNEVALAVTSSLSLRAIIDQIMLYGMPLGGARGVCIAFYDPAAGRFRNWVARGLSETYLDKITFPPSGLAEDVLRRGDYVLSNDRPGNPHPLLPQTRAEGVASVIGLPLVRGEQRLGVILFYRGDRDTFDFEEIELIRTFSHLAAHAIENARAHAHALDLAETDALTGLANRRKLEQRLEEALANARRLGQPLALVVLDLDRFKAVNDTHGHRAGDAVLTALAKVFQREIRDVDLAARSGGEEFMFVLPGTDEASAWRMAERIRQAVEAEVVPINDTLRCQVTASLGIASFPLHADDAETLMMRADRAMYVAKQSGRNRTAVYVGAQTRDGTPEAG